MKIGLLTQEYHLGENRFGGVGRAFGKIANWLADHGHEVTVYLQDRTTRETVERPGLRVVHVAPIRRLHWRLHPLIDHLPVLARSWLWHEEVNHGLGERILADYREGRIEVLLVNRGVTAPSLVTGGKLPTVVRMQYSYLRKQRVEQLPITLMDRWHDRVERAVIRHADGVYAPCHFTAEYARDFAGREVEVIRTPMFELQPARPWSEVQTRYNLPERFYLFWGGLIRVKGIHVLAKALPQVFKRDPVRRMVIVGSRRYDTGRGRTSADDIEALRDRFPDRLQLLPSLDPPELFAIIRQADVAVLPSIMDNLPNALLEAMYFGKVIVASRGASLDELIEHEKEGLLVTPGQPRELADAMVRAATMNEGDRTRMGAAAAVRVRAACEPDRVMAQVVELCAAAVERYACSGMARSDGKTA